MVYGCGDRTSTEGLFGPGGDVPAQPGAPAEQAGFSARITQNNHDRAEDFLPEQPPSGPEDTADAVRAADLGFASEQPERSTPHVTTAELRRPVFRTSDSTPSISTADLQRPRWATAPGVIGNERIA